jgi:hypothetical protein
MLLVPFLHKGGVNNIFRNVYVNWFPVSGRWGRSRDCRTESFVLPCVRTHLEGKLFGRRVRPVHDSTHSHGVRVPWSTCNTNRKLGFNLSRPMQRPHATSRQFLNNFDIFQFLPTLIGQILCFWTFFIVLSLCKIDLAQDRDQ